MQANELLNIFLQAWSGNDFAKMYENCQITWKSKYSKSKLKEIVDGRIKSYKVLDETVLSEFIVDFTISVRFKGETKKVTVRLLKESEPYKLSADGKWGANPISLIKGLY